MKRIDSYLDSRRPGVTALETAVSLPLLLLLLFALLDLGIAATRYNALSEVARRIGREAICRGSLVSTEKPSWGPEEYLGTIADDNEIVLVAHGMTPTMEASDVTVHVTWPDEDNAPRNRVHVEVSYLHQPLVPGICPWGTINLNATTTMQIVN